jgi:hypothetical protein
MLLQRPNGTLAESSVEVLRPPQREPEVVYNLTVEDNPNYFVGTSAFLCHNVYAGGSCWTKHKIDYGGEDPDFGDSTV